MRPLSTGGARCERRAAGTLLTWGEPWRRTSQRREATDCETLIAASLALATVGSRATPDKFETPAELGATVCLGTKHAETVASHFRALASNWLYVR